VLGENTGSGDIFQNDRLESEIVQASSGKLSEEFGELLLMN